MKRKKQTKLGFFVTGLILLSTISIHAENKNLKVETMLKIFAEDYEKHDRLPDHPITFGILITGKDGGKWHICLNKQKQKKVILHKGFPQIPTFYITTDVLTLKKIFKDQMNALTAAGRARMSDKAPFDFGLMEGFVLPKNYIQEILLPTVFHFFNRGKPEIIRFGKQFSRLIHGGNAVLFYYQKGLRTGWYNIEKGMKINADIKEATNTFPTLFIITKGKGKGRFGEKIVTLNEGMTIFVPAGMIHQFWTENTGGLEFIIIMFGSGA